MFLALILAAGISGPSVTHTAPAKPSAVSAPLNKGERRVKMICRDETPTGTRFVQRVCRTVDSMVQTENQSGDYWREMQMKSPLN